MKITFKLKGPNKISQSLSSKREDIGKIPRKAYDFFKKATPIKTGNARRRTRLRGNKIEASYPYAQHLDEGASKQAPEGMTKPTEEFIRKELDKIFKRK